MEVSREAKAAKKEPTIVRTLYMHHTSFLGMRSEKLQHLQQDRVKPYASIGRRHVCYIEYQDPETDEHQVTIP